ncbi:hypothetical protein Z950_3379 [Sulfitobacter mediterraneus KCTC 32188]|nr:hypothetical protein Z950_3379 [Sulfitobacter mediterraneus KCTC 32188]
MLFLSATCLAGRARFGPETCDKLRFCLSWLASSRSAGID